MNIRIRENIGKFHVEMLETFNYLKCKSGFFGGIEHQVYLYWCKKQTFESLKEAEDYVSEYKKEGKIVRYYE